MGLLKDARKRLLLKLKTYFSGKLFLVQLSAGVGAFVLRTIPAYILRESILWSIIAGQVGSYVGYISVYAVGYWLIFRKDYSQSGRSFIKDILGLQVAEQLPNLTTLVISGAWQGALIQFTGLPTWIGVNLGSWFGPHKIINLIAMLFSNTIKRAWIDKAWSPPERLRAFFRRIRNFGRSIDHSETPDSAQEQTIEEMTDL